MRRALNLPVLTLLAAVLGWAQPRPTAPAQAVNQLDASPSLFAVLAAVNAAGYDDEIESPSNHPLRKALREYLAGQNLSSLPALKRYVRDHNPRNLSQYISFALATSGPPTFGYRYPVNALPPDVAALNEFTPLVTAFYKEANLEDLWKRSQPVFDQVIAQYTEPVSRAILQANAYLRNPTSGYLGRRFQIYVDLLGAPNQVQYRTYVDDYFVVVTPAAELPVDQIRHAYLHYLTDPLTLKFAEELKKKRGLGDYALGSPILEEFYKSDFNLLATECFIKAIESRLDRKPALADQALREGFVITPAFAELLAIYEKQDQSMRLYFPDLVAGIDLRSEEKRLDHIDFVSERAERKIRVTPAEKPVELTGPAKTLEEAEKAYTDRQLDRARETYLRLIKETDEKPMHAKAYYGLARVSILNRDPETADRLFRKVLELEPDASTKSWSLLYLARLADSQGDREEAVKSYQAALAVEDAPESVRQAATKGLREAFVGK